MLRPRGRAASKVPGSLPDPVDPPELTARYRTLVVLAAVVVAAFAAWLSTGFGTPAQRRAVSDLVFIVAPLVAAASALTAHRRRRVRHTGWAWIALGCFTWAAGSLAWTYIELVRGVVAPFPSAADIGYVGYVIPIVVGLTRFPSARGNLWSRLRLTLDIVTMTGCLLLASAVWVLGPVLHATSGWFVRADGVAYPLADVTVATAVLARSMVFTRSRRLVWMTLSLGLLVEALVDSVYVARTFSGSYSPGHLLDAGWLVSFLLIALAAQTPASRATAVPQRREVAEPPSLLQQLLPYATVALAAAAVADRLPDVERHSTYLWFMLALGVVIAARQCVVVADHVALTRDLSAAVERRTAELRQQEQWWRDLVQNLSDVVMVIDRHDAIRYCSPSILFALGHSPGRLHSVEWLHAQIHPDDAASLTAHITPVLRGEVRRGAVEARVRRADGGHGWFEISAVGQLAEKALEGTVLTLHDVTDRHELTDRLSHQAFHDGLTGLPNRTLLMQRIDEALEQPNRQFALILIDLDDFKLVNDSHGHAAGDLLLEAIGKRLVKGVRPGDTVARLGGDEFAVLVNGKADRARATAERLATRINEPVTVGGRRFVVRASIGVVPADRGADESAHTLLSHADIALYQAKARRKGGVVLVHGEERELAARQVFLREQIAQPKCEQFSVAYQPIVDLESGRIRGLEALLRWNHPELGAVAPSDFIPLAEHGGSIGTLGWHVLETATAQLKAWQLAFPQRRLAMGVNVSVLQLDEPDFPARVRELLNTLELDPDQLVLELTEQALARDFETAVAVVADLRDSGVSVAVDDYGTGYSSLRYLHRFAADVVKIDRSFIANLSGSAHTQKIVRSVVDMAQSLDLQCIAEGIETPVQLELVRALGCELAQGYLFTPPLDVSAITALLAESTDFDLQTGTAVIPQPRRDRVSTSAS